MFETIVYAVIMPGVFEMCLFMISLNSPQYTPVQVF